MKNQLVFSLISADLYEIPEDEIVNLDSAQVPLTSMPPSNCRKCFGRGYTAKDIISNLYMVCSCTRKRIDFTKYNNKIEIASKVK